MPPGSTKDPLLPVEAIVGSTVPAAVVPKLIAALPEPVFRSAILKALQPNEKQFGVGAK